MDGRQTARAAHGRGNDRQTTAPIVTRTPSDDGATAGPGPGRPLTDELDAGQGVDPEELDQRLDLWLRPAQPHRAAAGPQTPRQHRQIHHQRRVREPQLGEVDDHVRLRAQSPRQRPATASLRAAVLVAGAMEQRGRVAEDYDRVKLSDPEDG